MTDQQIQIAADRKRFAVQPVQHHEMPKWFRTRLRNYCHATNQQETPWSLTDGPGIMDHWGSSIDENGAEIFVTEPYCDFYSAKTHRLAQLAAQRLGVHVRILPTYLSWHFPNRTLRIEFLECHHNRQMNELYPACTQCKTAEQHALDCKALRKARLTSI